MFISSALTRLSNTRLRSTTSESTSRVRHLRVPCSIVWYCSRRLSRCSRCWLRHHRPLSYWRVIPYYCIPVLRHETRFSTCEHGLSLLGWRREPSPRSAEPSNPHLSGLHLADGHSGLQAFRNGGLILVICELSGVPPGVVAVAASVPTLLIGIGLVLAILMGRRGLQLKPHPAEASFAPFMEVIAGTGASGWRWSSE